MFGRRRSEEKLLAAPTVGDMGRVYAIGDVHGRYDLFTQMLRLISEDLEECESNEFQIIFLGDLIDRGNQSKHVVELALQISKATDKVRFIRGNHEEVLLRSIEGDTKATDFFCKIGGRETLLSYGLSQEALDSWPPIDIIEWMRAHIPDEHIAFINNFADIILIEDYIFVHAGIRPNVAIEKQSRGDLHWIRDLFLDYEGPHPGLVIHGHSICEDVDEQPNRIGIDTGAYRSGRLTAIVLEGTARRYLTASSDKQLSDLDSDFDMVARFEAHAAG
ncbi:Bis(5'-nucleosyl)-tetraphosphatase, symmetrical [Sphingobium sp. CECT 9361]|nr:Bis(5'-nucleosyl)-tetraphosphatase, symmetrical [Sphingobium sp. CECT 9361]